MDVGPFSFTVRSVPTCVNYLPWFEDLESVRAFMDDLLVVSRGTYEEHLEELAIVMERLTKVRLKCKIDKCLFCRDRISWLHYY